MKEIMPYVISVLTALISMIVSIYVCNRNCKNEIKKLKLQNEQDIQKIQKQHENDLETMTLQHQQEMEKLEQIQTHVMEKQREEAALKAVTGITETFTENLTNSILDAPAVKNEINKQANNAFVRKKNRR
ncbi:MAG: hypothetical protein ACI4JA_03345 [Oscillospiraceae bacterium]